MEEKGITGGHDLMIASLHDSILLESCSTPVSALKVDAFKLGVVSAELSFKLLDGKKCETANYVDCSFQMR